jgi:hypothetical protein
MIDRGVSIHELNRTWVTRHRRVHRDGKLATERTLEVRKFDYRDGGGCRSDSASPCVVFSPVLDERRFRGGWLGCPWPSNAPNRCCGEHDSAYNQHPRQQHVYSVTECNRLRYAHPT